MAKDKEVSGDALASARAFTQGMVDRAARIQRFEAMTDRYADEDVYIESFTVRLNYRGEGGTLVVVRAHTPDGGIVGFSEGRDVLDALAGMCARLENKSIQWRKDKYSG